MKRSIAMRWVKALRSGKYIQGTGRLAKDLGATAEFVETADDTPIIQHCCLGVLGEIEDLKFDPTDSALRFYNGENPPIFDDDKTQNDLAVKNDYGWSFARIASYIERNYKKL